MEGRRKEEKKEGSANNWCPFFGNLSVIRNNNLFDNLMTIYLSSIITPKQTKGNIKRRRGRRKEARKEGKVEGQKRYYT